MNNIKRITIAAFVLVMIALAGFSASAATIEAATYENHAITVSGRCTDSNQVQVILFDPDNNPLYLCTVDVKDALFNKTLDASFNLDNGKTYTIKVADYNGKNTSSTTFTVEESLPSHVHSYGTAWLSDSTKHWHACDCGETSNESAHTFSKWVVTKAATAAEEGSRERTCSVCDYKEIAVISRTEETTAAPQATTEETTAAPQATNANEARVSPQTDDTAPMLLWTLLLLISCGTIAILVTNKTRKKAK